MADELALGFDTERNERGCWKDALRSVRGLPGAGKGEGVCAPGEDGEEGDGGNDDSLSRYSTHIFEND